MFLSICPKSEFAFLNVNSPNKNFSEPEQKGIRVEIHVQ